MDTSSSPEDRQKVWDLIKDIRIAMMVTQNASHDLSARPMAAAQTDFDGTLWFLTPGQSPKLDEIKADSQVCLAYSHPGKQDYVSIAGRARIVREKSRIKELWSEPMRTWFPKGPDESDIAAIAVDVDSAEYWDAPSSAFVYAYGYVKARLTGEPPAAGDNKRVTF